MGRVCHDSTPDWCSDIHGIAAEIVVMDDVVQPKGLDRLFGSLKHKYGAAGNTTSSGQSSFTRNHREDITGPIPVPELPAAAGFTVHSNDFFQTARRTTGE